MRSHKLINNRIATGIILANVLSKLVGIASEICNFYELTIFILVESCSLLVTIGIWVESVQSKTARPTVSLGKI